MDRSSLAGRFAGDGSQTWKTYVLEAHPDSTPITLLRDIFGEMNIEATDDVHLHALRVDDAAYVVDTIDTRFWSFHTNDPAANAYPPINAAVGRRVDLDYVWLPSSHLRAMEKYGQTKFVSSDFRAGNIRSSETVNNLSFTAKGGTSQELLDAISALPDYTYALSLDRVGLLACDDLLGSVEEAVTRRAMFLARGPSFALHQFVVASTIERYRGLVEAAESMALGFDVIDHDDAGLHGGRFVGYPIELSFSQPLTDFEGFIDELLSARAPFRLWGLVDDASERFADIEAVDLHVGGRVRIEVSPDMIRIHLRRGGCGNTIARLISNLQHHVDGNISAVEPSLQEHLSFQAA
jgi:hypothetical protein